MTVEQKQPGSGTSQYTAFWSCNIVKQREQKSLRLRVNLDAEVAIRGRQFAEECQFLP
jgi:hypothetical protein